VQDYKPKVQTLGARAKSRQTHRPNARRVVTLFLGLLLTLLFAGSANAQDIVVDATVDSDEITTDQRVILTVTMNAQPDSPPILPPLSGFQVVGQSSASQISVINGVSTAYFAYRYTLQPIEAGGFRIDPVTVFINGQQFASNSVTITVTQGSSPLPDIEAELVPPTELTGQDFYVEATLNNPSPYLGEQILYLFRFYQARELLGRPSYYSPDFVGFWNPQENEQTQTLNNLSDRTYRITTLVSPLFPTLSGGREIAPAEFQLPDGTRLLTERVNLSVKPLPQPEPEGFNGAVGTFTISAEVDKTTAAINEAITWRVRVEGIGNIDTLPEPGWPELAGWRIFENKSTVATEFDGGIVKGRREYERVLIPSVEGETTLPALDYIFFNPETEQYEQSSTQPVMLNVQGGEDTAGIANGVGEGLLPEIRPNRPTPSRLNRQPLRLLSNPLYWMLWLIPAGVVVVDKLLRVQRQRSAAEIDLELRQNAWRIASQAIKAARKDQSTRAEQAAERILTSYLSDKLGEPFVGLSQSARTQQLRQHHVRESLIRWTNRIYDMVDGARYGYASDEVNLLDEVEQLMSRFERGEQA
jgi:hypothetical protein